jgi:hypothetical protein
MKPKVYIETSVISYLMARPSRDILVAANQQVTQEWWQDRRIKFELYVSQLVEQEASSGDAEAVSSVRRHWRVAVFWILLPMRLNWQRN